MIKEDIKGAEMLNDVTINDLERCKRAVEVVLEKVKNCSVDLGAFCPYLIKHTVDNLAAIYNEVEKRESEKDFNALIK